MLNKLYSFFFNKANILRSAISKKEGESPWRVKTFSALNLFAVEMLEDLFKFLILLFKNPYDSFQLFTKQETLPICEYSYTDHRRFQKKVRLFSLAGMSSVISATIIINLILSLVVPGQIPSYAKTVNGPWDDWSLTDLAGDPPAGSAGTISINPANSSEITGTGTASTLGLKLASYTVTDDGTLSTTGSATGGTFGAGTNSSTTVSGSGAGASVGLALAVSSTAGSRTDYTVGIVDAYPEYPGGIAFDPITNSVWVGTDDVTIIDGEGAPSAHNISKINVTNGTRTNYVVGLEPNAVAFDSFTNSIWVTSFSDPSYVQKVNVTNGTRTNYLVGGYSGNGLVFDSFTNSIWVTNNANNGVSKVDVTNGTKTDYTVGSGPSYGGAFDSFTNSVWVTTPSSNVINKINVTNGTKTAYATGLNTNGTSANGTAFDPVTNSVWVANYNANTISKVNVTNGTKTDYAVGNGPSGVVFDSSTNSIWVTNYVSNTVSKVNVTNGTKTDYAVGSGPQGITFDPVTNSVWVAYYSSNYVSKIGTGGYSYYSSGTSTSAVIDLGAKATFTTLSWTEILNGQTITMKARSSANSDMSGATAWGSCSNIAKNANLSTGGCVTDGHQYIQYQATLSTANTAVTPTLDSVTIGYNQYLSSSAVSNLRFNTGYTNVIWTSVSWVRSDSNTASSTIKVKSQAKTAADSTALAFATFVGYNNTATNSSTYFDRPNANCSYAAGKFGDTAGDNETKETVTCTINTGDTTYLNPTASSNQWMELKLILESDGAQTPVIDAARATYSVNSNPEVAIAASPAISQSTSSSNFGIVAFNSNLKDSDTMTGTNTATGGVPNGWVWVALEYSSTGSFGSSPSASVAAAGNLTITNIGGDNLFPSLENGGACVANTVANAGTLSGLGFLNIPATTSVWQYACPVDKTLVSGNSTYNTNYSFAWNAKAETNIYSGSAKVKLWLTDMEGINPLGSVVSSSFVLDTTAPSSYSVKINGDPAGGVGQGNARVSCTDDSGTDCGRNLSSNGTVWTTGANSTGWGTFTGGTTTSESISSFIAEAADRTLTLYYRIRDGYGNEIPNDSGITGKKIVSLQRPINLALQDVSNVLATPATYRNFLSWEIVSAPTVPPQNNFYSYNIYRCDPASSSDSCVSNGYSKIGTAAPTGDRNVNFYTDPASGSLTADQIYYYRVATEDSNGNISNWSSFKDGKADGTQNRSEGGGGGDVTPPAISSFSVPSANITSSSANIIWTTSETTNAGVFYGTSYGNEKSTLSYGTSQSITLTSLSANVLHNIQIKSTDASGNQTICDSSGVTSLTTASNGTVTVRNNQLNYTSICPSATYSFATSANASPIISNIQISNITNSSAVISWTTDINSDSCVGTDSNPASRTYTSETCNSDSVTSHSVTVGGLTQLTKYYINIKSRSGAGILADNCSIENNDSCPTINKTDTNFSFETGTPVGGGGGGGSAGKSDFEAPKIGNVDVSDITEDSVNIMWDTNEKSSSFVQYGKDKNNLTDTFGQLDSVNEDHKVTLKSLNSGTTYYFQAVSVDWAGNVGLSDIGTFVTKKSVEEVIKEEIGEAEKKNEEKTEKEIVAEKNTTEVLADLKKQIEDQGSSITDPLQTLLDSMSSLIPEPIIIGESPTIEVAATSAAISWRTDKKSTSFVALSREDQFDSASQEPYKLIVGNPEDSTKEHKVEITGLLPATKYHYQVRSKALLGNTSESKDFTFTTKSELPQIVSFLQKKAENDKTAVIYWETSIPTDSVVKYTPYIKGKLSPKDAKLQGKPDMIADHEITLTNLDPGTVYQIEISGKDPFGNAVSKTLPDFTTAIDKDAPVISQVRIESAMISGKTPKIQTIISYRTDEPATSQIYFAEGGSDKFKQMTPDLNLSTIHTSVITDFKPASIYRIRIESTDESGNTATSRDFTILTPAQSESIIDIIIKTFENTFGWVKNIRF